MADRITRAQRSENMRRIRASGSKAERAVEAAVSSLGYRFKTHDRSLPGSPDVVLENHSIVIFVHGCFWHRHRNCRFTYMPKSRQAFWRTKFDSNVARDSRAYRQLRRLGWSVLTVWECQTKDPPSLRDRLRRKISRSRESRQSAAAIAREAELY